MFPSSKRFTRYDGTRTFLPFTAICPWIMSWRACFGVFASPCRYTRVWSLLPSMVSILSASTSSSVEFSGSIPSVASRRSIFSLSFSVISSPSRASRCRACPRTLLSSVSVFHISLLFFSPYLYSISRSFFILSPCQGCEGVSYFFLGSRGSPMVLSSASPHHTHGETLSFVAPRSLTPYREFSLMSDTPITSYFSQ